MKGGMGADREQGNTTHGEATVKDILEGGGETEGKAWEVDTCLPGRGAKPWPWRWFRACPAGRACSLHVPLRLYHSRKGHGTQSCQAAR